MNARGKQPFGQPESDAHEELLPPDLQGSRGPLSDALRAHGPHTAHRVAQTLKNMHNPNDRAFARRFLGEKLVRGTTMLLDDAEEGTVNLREAESAQREVLRTMEAEGSSAPFLRVFGTTGKLSPPPTPFWRVARESEEYMRRLGINVERMLADFATDDRKQLLVEFGPGNNNARSKRDSRTRDAYVDMAICDRLYWPVNTLIGRLIDFGKLERESGPLNAAEKELLCDFLYKILVIESGQASQLRPHDDTEVLENLRRDPRTIIEHLREKSPLLETTNAVPADGYAGANNTDYIFPNQTTKPDSAAFHRACQTLSAPGGFERCLQDDADVYKLLPAYPAGTIVADFDRIDRLKDDQIDIAYGVRSTVYKEGDDYVQFMAQMTKKLAKDGLYIDDNMRENSGVNYRLKEAKEMQNATGYPVHVILGPGIPGDDFKDDHPVPLSVVLTQSAEKLAYVQAHLEPGYSMVKLDDLLHDVTYIKTLAHGKTYESVRSLLAA